jgi:tRNA (guanine37-N1)-methyltransferase
MVMLAQPIAAAMADVCGEDFHGRRIYMGPRGRRLDTALARELASEERLVLLCGHYEGVDQRALDTCVDEEISIGDYVLSGGELAAAVLVDAVTRLQEGALNDAESAAQDSFEGPDGLLDCPHYTHPREHALGEAPAILRSGNHAAIARWRRMQALGRTWLRRPELLDEAALSAADRRLLQEFRQGLQADPASVQENPSKP